MSVGDLRRIVRGTSDLFPLVSFYSPLSLHLDKLIVLSTERNNDLPLHNLSDSIVDAILNNKKHLIHLF